MRNIPVAKFKQNCLAILDRIDAGGIILTKRGRPIARVLPITDNSKDLIGSLRGKLTVKGDVLSTGLEWDAQP